MTTQPLTARAAARLAAPTHLALLGVTWLASLAAFVATAGNVTQRFSSLALGAHLGTVVSGHLRVLPAYVVVGLVLTALTAPALRLTLGPTPSRARRVLHSLGFDLLVLLCATGGALLVGPGVFDTLARKLPHVDLYALARWHVLHGLALGFAALCLWAVATWLGRFARWGIIALGLFTAWVLAPQRPPANGRGTALSRKEQCAFARQACASRATDPRCVAMARACEAMRDDAPPRSVLIIASDSWRFDRVGVHGATHADLTPNIDAFAKQAIDLKSLHVATASTLESWTTILTGLWPRTHGLRSMYPSREEVAAAEQRPSLPRLLDDAGYESFVSSDWVGNCFALVDLGFSRRHVGAPQTLDALLLDTAVRAHPLVPLFFGSLAGLAGDLLVPGRASFTASSRPAVLTDQLFDDLDSSVQRGHPFFGVLFASPTHLPYNARYPFNIRYADPAYDGPHRYQVEVSAHELITTGFSPTLPPATITHVRDLYDGAVADFDDTVGRVLDALNARGLADSTIVIITSDHGEDLYDPGSTLGHGTNFFGGDQSTQLPFFIRVPDGHGGFVRPGSSVDAVTRTVDVMPTLLDLLGFEPPKGLDGVNLGPLLRGEVQDPQLTAFAETCYLFFPKSRAMTVLTDAERAEVVELAGAEDTLEVDEQFNGNLVLAPKLRDAVIAAKDRMVRNARYKLIELPGKTRPIHRLYDLVADPHQQHDLSGQGLPVEAELTAQLNALR